MQRIKETKACTVQEAVREIIPYLEDTSEPNQVIYYDGWYGLGASAVLTSIAEDPPPSLRSRFDTIIHIDCSRWQNRRQLQRTIAQNLYLPQQVMSIFERQDEDDDFGGVDEGSRAEIREVVKEIHGALRGKSYLVVFHNGSDRMVHLNDFGIPRVPDNDPWSTILGKILWTFRGRLRVSCDMKDMLGRIIYGRQPEAQPGTYLYLASAWQGWSPRTSLWDWNSILHGEAAEIVGYTKNKLDATSEIAACFRYLLSLNSLGGAINDFNWVTHASNYWVCDGIIQRQQVEAWDIATALRAEIRLEDSPLFFPVKLHPRRKVVIISTSTSISPSTSIDYLDEGQSVPATTIDYLDGGEIVSVPATTTSLFCSDLIIGDEHLAASLPNKMFQRADNLHVLKLCHCTFNFSSPPFLQCKNLRFLGLNTCKNQPERLEGIEKQQDEEEQDYCRQTTEFFHSLWVLDISCTDWELSLSPNILEKTATSIREINIKKGRIWHKNHAWTWRHLHNIHKLIVIEPTCPWETGNIEELSDMVKLELLDLTGNSTIQVLPSLSGAIGLKILVLDGCIGMKHVGPGSLPPSLETFSFDAGAGKGHGKEAKISRISLAGCARLVNFRLRGLLPHLEELDLSSTSVKALDLKDEVVQAPYLQQVILLGCQQLRAVLWPKKRVAKQRTVRISTRNIRLIQSLLVLEDPKINVSVRLSHPRKDNDAGETVAPHGTGQLFEFPRHKSPVSRTHHHSYNDINFDIDYEGSRAIQFEPLDLHLEIGEGISNINVVTVQGIRSVIRFMNRVRSLLLQDNSSMTTVIPESMISITEEEFEKLDWSSLTWCHVERCPKMDTVFTTNSDAGCFEELETFLGVDLLMARCIWSKGRLVSIKDDKTFAKLRAINLHSCPRLIFVLPLSWFYTLSSLETLCIICCGDLSQVFLVESMFQNKLSTVRHPRGVLEFPNLKNIHLHELPKLHHICEAKMYAPKLEAIRVRGCWSLKRLPATSDRPDSRPIVDCEKDWWNKLEWDGKMARHHPSLFQPRHSKYYKKTLLRSSVLR